MPITVRSIRWVHAAAIFWFAACATQTPRGGETSSSRSPGAVADTPHLVQLEREARALVKSGGCDLASACRAAPVGWRGCGGPRAYVVYCPVTTDTAALYRKLEELRRAEVDYNERAGVISTCEYRAPPNVGTAQGQCSALP